MLCALKENCPLVNKKGFTGRCPLREDCRRFPVGQLRDLLNRVNNYLDASINSSTDQDLTDALNQLKADILLVTSKLS